MGGVSTEVVIPPSLTDTKYFEKLNREVKYRSHQVLGGDMEVRVDKTDIVISAPANSTRVDLLYYVVMGKLNLAVKPIFMKMLYNTLDGG